MKANKYIAYIFSLFFLAQFFIFPANAQILKLAHPGFSGDDTELVIYDGAGHEIGILNSTAPLDIGENSTDLYFYMQQHKVNPLNDPWWVMNWFINGGWMAAVLVGFVIAVIIALIAFAFAQGKKKAYR